MAAEPKWTKGGFDPIAFGVGAAVLVASWQLPKLEGVWRYVPFTIAMLAAIGVARWRRSRAT